MRFVRRTDDGPPTLESADLRDCLAEYPLRLAVLFGSQATGTANARSDLDVGVVFEDPVDAAGKRELLDEITVAITRATGFEAVDLLDLAEAPPAVGYAALSEGELLLGDEAEAIELEARFLVKKLDFAPVRERWQAALDERIESGTYGRR